MATAARRRRAARKDGESNARENPRHADDEAEQAAPRAVSIDLLIYALVATATPLGLAATLVVIESGRSISLVFALAFVAAQTLTCSLVVLLGVSARPTPVHDHSALRSWLELGFGVVLIAAALAVRRRGAKRTPHSTALLERLHRLRPGTSLAAGLALGIGGPKRLVVTILAGSSIAASAARGSHVGVLVILYSLVATLLVWLPVLVFVIAGDRVLGLLHAAERLLVEHEQEIAFWSLLVVGAFASAHAALTLSG